MFENHFTQFVDNCCAEVKRSPKYNKAEEELRAAMDTISAKLGNDDKQMVNDLDDIISAVESVVGDDHFKAGFLAGVRLGNE